MQDLYKTEVKGIHQACDTAKEKVQDTRRSPLSAGVSSRYDASFVLMFLRRYSFDVFYCVRPVLQKR